MFPLFTNFHSPTYCLRNAVHGLIPKMDPSISFGNWAAHLDAKTYFEYLGVWILWNVFTMIIFQLMVGSPWWRSVLSLSAAPQIKIVGWEISFHPEMKAHYFKDVLEITLLWRTKSVKARSVFAPQIQKLRNLEHQIKIDISFHRPRNEFTLYERYLCSFRCKRTNARKSRTTTPIFALPVVGEWAAGFTSHIFSLYLFDARNISQTNIFLAEEKYTNIFYFTLNSSIYKLESLRPLAASFPVHVGPE